MALSFWPALNLPVGGVLGPGSSCGRASQWRSSSVQRSTSSASAATARRLPASATSVGPNTKNSAEARCASRSNERCPMSASTGARLMASPVSIRLRKVSACSQWATRSVRVKRRTQRRSDAVTVANVGVDIVAVLLPVAGHNAVDHLDVIDPFCELVAVHPRDDQPQREALIGGEGVAVQSIGQQDVRLPRLVQGQALGVGLIETADVEGPGV